MVKETTCETLIDAWKNIIEHHINSPGTYWMGPRSLNRDGHVITISCPSQGFKSVLPEFNNTPLLDYLGFNEEAKQSHLYNSYVAPLEFRLHEIAENIGSRPNRSQSPDNILYFPDVKENACIQSIVFLTRMKGRKDYELDMEVSFRIVDSVRRFAADCWMIDNLFAYMLTALNGKLDPGRIRLWMPHTWISQYFVPTALHCMHQLNIPIDKTSPIFSKNPLFDNPRYRNPAHLELKMAWVYRAIEGFHAMRFIHGLPEITDYNWENIRKDPHDYFHYYI